MSRSAIINVMKKFSFYNHLSVNDQKRIHRAKKQGLANILRQNKKNSIRVTVAVEFYYFLQRIFKTITLRQSILVMNAAGSIALVLIAFTTVLKTGVYQNFTEGMIPPIEANIISLKGEVSINNPDGIPVKAEISNKLSEGYAIITGAESYIDIWTGDNKITRFGPDTAAKIKSLSEKNGTELFLVKGIILSAGKHNRVRASSNETGTVTLPGSEPGYIISTANCSVTAIGTSFSVSFRDNKTVIAISGGKVHIKLLNRKNDGSIEERILEAGSRADVSDKISVSPIQNGEYDDLSGFAAQYPENSEMKPVPAVEDSGSGRDKKIEKLLKQKSRTFNDIKDVFKRVDVVTLYSGEVIRGAILTGGRSYSIITTEGIRDVSADEISSVQVIK